MTADLLTCDYDCTSPAAYRLTTDCGCVDIHICEADATDWFQLKVLMLSTGRGGWCCGCERDITINLEEL